MEEAPHHEERKPELPFYLFIDLSQVSHQTVTKTRPILCSDTPEKSTERQRTEDLRRTPRFTGDGSDAEAGEVAGRSSSQACARSAGTVGVCGSWRNLLKRLGGVSLPIFVFAVGRIQGGDNGIFNHHCHTVTLWSTPAQLYTPSKFEKWK